MPGCYFYRQSTLPKLKKKRIALKELEPESSEDNPESDSSVEIITISDEDKDSFNRQKVDERPTSSKLQFQKKLSVASSSLEVEVGILNKSNGREDVEAITSLEQQRKKVKDDESEVKNIVFEDKQQDLSSGFL